MNVRGRAVVTKKTKKKKAAKRRQGSPAGENPSSEYWTHIGSYYRPLKKPVTVRLDADIVAWLRRPGKGYQTRLNQVLRAAMLKAIKKSA